MRTRWIRIVCATAAALSAGCGAFCWMFCLWQGYGEDLLNYNRSIFRAGVGLALAR